MKRLAAAAGIVAAAIACTPAALAPGINSADLICIFAPIAVAVVLARPSKTPAGGDAPTQMTNPSVKSSPAGSTETGR